MSPEQWSKRLTKRGLVLDFYEGVGPLQEWTVFIQPIDTSRGDPRFRPLIGIAIHVSRDEAIRMAVADFDFAEAEQLREKVALALAGEQRA